jgi:hypothetical protein
MQEIAPGATFLYMKQRDFHDNLCNYFGITASIGTWRYGEPPIATWDIECHAYTGTIGFGGYDAKAGVSQDSRIVRDGVLAFAASGNDLNSVKGLWHRSWKTGMCGTPSSPKGTFNTGTGYGGLQPFPDIVVPTQWTSIAAPVMAACAALLAESGIKADAYEFAKDSSGNMRIDLTAARLLGGVPTPVETFEPRNEVVKVIAEPYAPATVEQSRAVTTYTRYWEEGSQGSIRNERTEPTTVTEKRTVPLPTT